jgi:hypothetical protein
MKIQEFWALLDADPANLNRANELSRETLIEYIEGELTYIYGMDDDDLLIYGIKSPEEFDFDAHSDEELISYIKLGYSINHGYW